MLRFFFLNWETGNNVIFSKIVITDLHDYESIFVKQITGLGLNVKAINSRRS